MKIMKTARQILDEHLLEYRKGITKHNSFKGVSDKSIVDVYTKAMIVYAGQFVAEAIKITAMQEIKDLENQLK